MQSFNALGAKSSGRSVLLGTARLRDQIYNAAGSNRADQNLPATMSKNPETEPPMDTAAATNTMLAVEPMIAYSIEVVPEQSLMNERRVDWNFVVVFMTASCTGFAKHDARSLPVAGKIGLQSPRGRIPIDLSL